MGCAYHGAHSSRLCESEAAQYPQLGFALVTQIESLEKELAKVRSQKDQQVNELSKQYEERQRRWDKEVRESPSQSAC